MNYFKKGFTLIELLVVIAIVGILSGIVVLYMNGATDAAKDSIRKSDISTLRKALLAYNTLNGSYPVATCADINSGCTDLSNALIPGYLGILPSDPNSASSYSYTSTDGTDFTVAATLSDATGYSYTASTGFGTTGGGSGSSYVSTCEADMGGGISCTETTVGDDAVYTFTRTGAPGSINWTVPDDVNSVEYLVVAGGGAGGGTYEGGGGGAGGLLTGTLTDLSLKTVTVGDGGTGSTSRGGNGGNSVFATITAIGGGGGGCDTGGAALVGGSGGGSGSSYGTAGAAGTSGQGYAGGASTLNSAAGGGGGAGAVGVNGVQNTSRGNGGIGVQSDITGSSVYYAGGGGGGCYYYDVVAGGLGGSGGGGNGSPTGTGGYGFDGIDGLGGGGGGAAGRSGSTYTGGDGGSGVVIIRFTKP